MTSHILVLNAGSSSLKFAAFNAVDLTELIRGQISGLGTTPRFEISGVSTDVPIGLGYDDALSLLLDELARHGLAADMRCAVGHRLVHGGTRFTRPVLMVPENLGALEALSSLAPLHMPFGIAVLKAMQQAQPGVPQIACFDTAFHATQPDLATRLPLPRRYFDKGYRRYGFHGLNYEHVVHGLPLQTGQPLPRRLLAAHLGSGASMCGIVDGRSVATTMGFSTADGLVMGTRTGSLDPGVIVALLRDEKLSLHELENLLYRQSGLQGLSGISADMRVLLESAVPEAKEAVDYYCHSAARHAASLLPAMGGIDAVVFTGGVGENAAVVRDNIMLQLAWMGLPDDAVHVIAANEERTIARHVFSFLQ